MAEGKIEGCRGIDDERAPVSEVSAPRAAGHRPIPPSRPVMPSAAPCTSGECMCPLRADWLSRSRAREDQWAAVPLDIRRSHRRPVAPPPADEAREPSPAAPGLLRRGRSRRRSAGRRWRLPVRSGRARCAVSAVSPPAGAIPRSGRWSLGRRRLPASASPWHRTRLYGPTTRGNVGPRGNPNTSRLVLRRVSVTLAFEAREQLAQCHPPAAFGAVHGFVRGQARPGCTRARAAAPRPATGSAARRWLNPSALRPRPGYWERVSGC